MMNHFVAAPYRCCDHRATHRHSFEHDVGHSFKQGREHGHVCSGEYGFNIGNIAQESANTFESQRSHLRLECSSQGPVSRDKTPDRWDLLARNSESLKQIAMPLLLA